MCSHRPRLCHCTYLENILMIYYYIVYDILLLYRTRVQHIALFSHICQCPRDDQTHYNAALYYFFCRCYSQPEFGQCLIYCNTDEFSASAEIYKKMNNDDDNKNLEQWKYLVTLRGFSVSVSYLSHCTWWHYLYEHRAEDHNNIIFVIYDVFFPFSTSRMYGIGTYVYLTQGLLCVLVGCYRTQYDPNAN